MKKMTQKLMFLFLLLVVGVGYSQKVAVIGINHVGTDGFTFVVTQDLTAGEIIYFTENEYNDAANAFDDQAEATVAFTAGSAILKGNVVFVSEPTTDTFTVSCTGGGVCGTAVKVGTSGFFALATDGETLYAYSDSDNNPANGVTTIHSVMFTGDTQPGIVNGGTIPANQNPSADYPTAIVIDGFPAVQPNRVEFTPTVPARTDVSKVVLENPSNYVHAQTNQALSTIFFTNLNLVASNPVVSVTASPLSVNENSGTGMVYTFSLSANATSNLTINFTVGGSATFSSDYSQSGAASFNASSGTVTILNGTNTASVTLTPIGDSTLEANETISLTINAGTGYVAGSPGAATTTINNDDTLAITPIVAVAGINHGATSDGFSFVALQDISAGTVVYFTENTFNTSTLTFTGAEGVMQWTAPAGGLARGQVVVAMETGANSFTTTCSSGSCGSVSVVSGTFSLASTGEELFAYLDSDNNPLNGVTSVQAVLYTGTSITPGGNIPSNQDPGTVYPGAVVVDGFPAINPSRTEYNPALRGVTVDRANFQSPSNWLHAQADATLSTVPFANIIISTGVANPFASVSVSPASVLENSGTAMVYTFSLTSPASGNVTVNFTVSGTATFTTDYTATGASSFTSTTGSVVILNGASSATVSVTPVGDTGLEVQETVILTIASGTGYDGGSPNSATGFINNDDTSDSDPIVAITGISHVDPDGFSFVAAQDIPANTVVYFTDNSFNSSTLLFGSGEAVIRWTSPGTAITKGNVVVVTETAPDSFTVTCSNGTCGSVTLLSGNLAVATTGETLYAYEDNDTNPSNGVTDIYAVLFTGTSSVSGGTIPSIEDPSSIFLSALVVDGFPASAPARTEYDATKRAVLVTDVNFEDVSNWVHGQSPPALSTVPFANLNILDSEDPVAICQNISVTPNVGTGSVTITAADINNGSTDNVGIVSYSIDVDTFTCENIGSPVLVTLTVTDAAGNSSTCTSTVTVLPNATSTFTQVAPICSGDSFTLPTTSNNGFTGTWSPVIDNENTTTYTFTPDAGQCGSSTTMTVVVNPSTSNTTTVSACDSYTWSVNGTTYTVSGTYSVVTGCDSEILELTINTTPTVSIGTPAAACEGDTLTLTSTSGPQTSASNFVGAYDVANWTFSNSNADGSVNTSGAPSSIAITGGNNGSQAGGDSNFTITIPSDTTLSFDWSYSTSDGAQFDTPRIIVNGTPTNMTGYDTGGSTSQSGTMSVALNSGDTFAFNMNTGDNIFGAATVAITNFAASVGPDLVWTASNGGTIVGATDQSSVTVTTTGTYTLTATIGTCSASDFVDVTFTPQTTPLFTQVDPICSGGSFSLPTTSNNGITGVWSPSIDNTTTTTYTFTPDANQCASTTTMTVVVNPSTSTTTTVAACVTYTWSVNGTTYTTSGTYTEVSGCDTQILQLTINTFPVTSSYEVCQGQTVVDGLVSDLSPGSPLPNFSGDTTGAPAFNRPNTMDQGGVCVNNTGSGLSVNYVTHSFTAPASGAYTFSTCSNATWDTFLALYESPFNPAGLCAGNSLVASIDDFCDLQSTLSATLVQGTTYTLVVCGFSSVDFGTYTVVSTSPVAAPNVEWYTDAVGGSPIATGSPFNPVGVAGSGILDTNTPGDTTFYAQFPGTECRTPAVFTINATPNAPTGAASQSFSSGATLADVVVAGTNIQWYDAASNGNALPTSTVLVNGATYYATQTSVNGCESPTFAVTVAIGTGVTNVIPSQCGVTLDAYNSIVYANLVPGAQRYSFRVTHTGTNQVIVKEYVLRNLYLSSLSFYEYDQSYSIEVAVRRNGIWEPYGVACTVSTPVALTQVRATQCNQMLATSNTLVYADLVSAVLGYRFKVINLTTLSEQIIDRPIRTFPFGLVTDYSDSTVYSVEVAVLNTDGNYLPYGPLCTVTTPGEVREQSKEVKAEFMVVGYPNPFSENFKLNLTSNSTESITVSVYDMLGRTIDTKVVNAQDIENFEIGSGYPNGVYNVIVSQGDSVQTVRMVKR